jgi:stage III sporulation protein AF
VSDLEWLAGWLKSVVAAMVLAGFLEMLLPNNELKGVTRMVMGLLIILVLAQPLLKVFHLPQELEMNLPELQTDSGPAGTSRIVAEGLNLRNQWLTQFGAGRREAYEARIGKLLKLVEGIQVERTQVVMEGGTVQSVGVAVRPRSGADWDRTRRAALTEEISDSIQLVCPVQKERIEVIWDE